MSQTSATCLEEATCLKLEEEAAVLHELAAFASLTVLCHAIYYRHVTSASSSSFRHVASSRHVALV